MVSNSKKENNIKIRFFFLFFLVLVTLISFTLLRLINQKNTNDTDTKQSTVYIQTEDDDITLHIEIADTEAKRRNGLMNRTSLDSNSGMLFVFPDEQERVFWMKNTYIPLDIVFIDGSGKIINIAYDAKVNQIEETYPSTKPASYVLEVNAGWCNENKVQINDHLLLDNLDFD